MLFLVILNLQHLKLEKEKGRNSVDSVIGDREPLWLSEKILEWWRSYRDAIFGKILK